MTVKVFLAGNDELVVPLLPNDSDVRVLGVASPHLLHVVADVVAQGNLASIEVVDVSAAQLHWFSTLVHAVIGASSRFEFLESLLDRPLPPAAREQLAAVPPARERRIHGSGTGAFDLEANLWRLLEEPGIAALLPGAPGCYGMEVDSMLFGRSVRQLVSVVACLPVEPGRCATTLGWGSGYLRDEASYTRTRAALATRMLRLRLDDLGDVLPAQLAGSRSPGSVLLLALSNVFHRFFMVHSQSLARAACLLATATPPPTVVLDTREPADLLPELRQFVEVDS